MAAPPALQPECPATRGSADRYRHVHFCGIPQLRQGGSPAVRHIPGSKGLQPAVETDALPDPLFATICRRSGVNASHYRPSIFRRRRAACLRAVRARTPEAALELVDRDRHALGAAFGALMIGVTAFFRDAHVFDALQPLLPALAASGGDVRCLSVGCSDGAELYSVAMLLAEAGMLSSAKLCGIDCREAAIASAVQGRYTAAAVASLSPKLLGRYFPRDRAGYLAGDDLRRVCTWRCVDAMGELDAVGEQDIVLCRNLVIYLTPAAAQRLWRKLARLVRPGGLLVVGKAERPAIAGLERIGPCLFRKLEVQP